MGKRYGFGLKTRPAKDQSSQVYPSREGLSFKTLHSFVILHNV